MINHRFPPNLLFCLLFNFLLAFGLNNTLHNYIFILHMFSWTWDVELLIINYQLFRQIED